MSIGKTLLQGTSDFWLRYFADTEIIERGHEAVLESVGSAYTSLLGSIMRLSLADAPLTEMTPWQLMVIFEDQLIEVTTGQAPAASYWLWRLPLDIRDLAFLQNVALAPGYFLEKDVDFELIADDRDRLDELRFFAPEVPTTGWYLLFPKDPFKWTTDNKPVPGFGYNTSLYSLRTRVTSDEVDDWTALGVSVGAKVRVVHDDGVVSFATVTAKAVGYMTVSARTELLSSAPGMLSVGDNVPLYNDFLWLGDPLLLSVSVVSVPTRLGALSGWAPQPEIDHYSLYELYGFPMGVVKEPSTEAYRELLRGLWSIYIQGPTHAHIEAALSVINGYPVIRTNGEIVTSVSQTSAGIEVVTNHYTTTDGVLAITLGTEEKYTLPSGTALTADVIYSARTYLGLERDGEASIFTDLDWLASPGTPGGFITAGGIGGTSKIVIGADTYPISIVNNASLQVTVGFIPGAPVAGQTWSLQNAGVEIAAGTAGAFLANTAVDVPLNAFAAIADAYRVSDLVSDPTWWHGVTIPPGIIDGLAASRRRVTVGTFPLEYGYRGYEKYYGDLGFFYGANSDGVAAESLETAPGSATMVLYDNNTILNVADINDGSLSFDAIVGSLWILNPDDVVVTRHSIELKTEGLLGSGFAEADLQVGGRYVEKDDIAYTISGLTGGNITGFASLRYAKQRHNSVAYLLMDKFLKWNSFGILFDVDTAPNPQALSLIVKTLLEARPAHTYPFIAKESEFHDRVLALTDVFAVDRQVI